jgi:hypothetical protein
MKTDYNSISFRNKDVDRLSGNTTKSPGQMIGRSAAEAINARNGNTPEARAKEAAKQAIKSARKDLRKQ